MMTRIHFGSIQVSPNLVRLVNDGKDAFTVKEQDRHPNQEYKWSTSTQIKKLFNPNDTGKALSYALKEMDSFGKQQPPKSEAPFVKTLHRKLKAQGAKIEYLSNGQTIEITPSASVRK